MVTKKVETAAEISVAEVKMGSVTFCVLGTSPLIMNRMSKKAREDLLAPKGRKTEADKAASIKHDPMREYRDSPYILSNESCPTYLAMLPTAFKGAMRTAALDLPGAKKSADRPPRERGL